MFGPVITTEAHLAFSGARTHSNNTAETTAMIEALSFLGPRGPVARGTFTNIQEIGITNVLIMPPHWGHSALCPILTSLYAGFIATLISLPVVVDCDNIGDVLEKLRNIRAEISSLPQ